MSERPIDTTQPDGPPAGGGRAFVLRMTDGQGANLRELRVSGGVATIGRDKGCTVVLGDPAVSRQHARIEVVQDALKLSDPGSANGVWLGNRRVKEATLGPGQIFRIGTTLFECRLERRPADADRTMLGSGAASTAAAPPPTRARISPPPAAAAPPPPLAPTPAAAVQAAADVGSAGFLLNISSEGDGATSRQVVVPSSSATIGRDRACTVVLADKDVSRRHTSIERVGSCFEISDLGSSNGTWLQGRRLGAKVALQPGQSFRIGKSTTVECLLPPSAQVAPAQAKGEQPAPPAFGETMVVPVTAAQLVAARKLEDEGEPLELGGHQAFLLEDPTLLYYVVAGGVDIFTVAVKGGQPEGARTHFLGVLPGQCLFGFDLANHELGSGFLAVPKQGTRLRKIPLARLQQIASSRANAAAVVALLETWTTGLSRCLTRGLKPPQAPLSVKPGERTVMKKGARARAAEGVVWTPIWSGSLLFDDMATPVFGAKQVLFPLTPDSWAEAVSDEFGELALEPVRTADALGAPGLWQGLAVFQQVLCECEFINKKLAVVDEFIRLEEKERYAEAARAAAYDAIGSVLRTEAASPREFLQTGSAEPVLSACRLVGAAMGIQVKPHPDANENLTYEEKLGAIASISGFRTRVVALRGEWWTHDNGPLLALREQTKTPVALLPAGPRAYDYVDATTGEHGRVTAQSARTLFGFAYVFYRPFPDGALSVKDVVRFGARGLVADARLLLMMGVTIGVLGTLAPYATGRIFDSAIPQADRTMLLAFGLALFASGLATAAFKLTQGIATQRIQGKMEYSIQSALWDRLLNAPANFFRQYPAGDLADRAAGVDAIQQLISGAAIGAVLGSFSGLFYVVLMFMYNLHLALVAIALTLTFVGVTSLANYLQLRHQRVEMQLRGRISGLVLNLITGVGKLRICGAEYHAFKIWAQEFAAQRKVSFSIGRIKNTVTVFSGVFPIISSMAIFMIMLKEQMDAAEQKIQPPSTGEFIAFNAAYALFLTAVQALADSSLNMLRVVPIYERLKPIVTTPAEVDSSKAYPGRVKGEIELSHVRFRYVDDGPWIISDVSLKIRPGQFVAFVGGSGSGKSTLMRLMLGFEKPATGSIYYDGQDLASLDLRLLRQQLGVVLQVSRVLPTDIYRNIVGVSSRTIDEAWAAAEAAGLAEDVRRMPMGMHTYVSEGGGTLSGGQRQRLLIARAVANKPKIIFLDEATSALDNRTQAIVTESMDRLEATRIVIAHRLSTIINAHVICYLDNGRLAEMGSYQELMDKNGLFAQLARRQMA